MLSQRGNRNKKEGREEKRKNDIIPNPLTWKTFTFSTMRLETRGDAGGAWGRRTRPKRDTLKNSMKITFGRINVAAQHP